jgi:hypothetical protein
VSEFLSFGLTSSAASPRYILALLYFAILSVFIFEAIKSSARSNSGQVNIVLLIIYRIFITFNYTHVPYEPVTVAAPSKA